MAAAAICCAARLTRAPPLCPWPPQVMAAAADTLTPVTLELGGKDPIIICEDADLDRVGGHWAPAAAGCFHRLPACLLCWCWLREADARSAGQCRSHLCLCAHAAQRLSCPHTINTNAQVPRDNHCIAALQPL